MCVGGGVLKHMFRLLFSKDGKIAKIVIYHSVLDSYTNHFICSFVTYFVHSLNYKISMSLSLKKEKKKKRKSS